MLYKTRGAMVKYEEKLMYEKQVFDTFFITLQNTPSISTTIFKFLKLSFFIYYLLHFLKQPN